MIGTPLIVVITRLEPPSPSKGHGHAAEQAGLRPADLAVDRTRPAAWTRCSATVAVVVHGDCPGAKEKRRRGPAAVSR